ncbi:MAG: patatin-like phospholipase family protein [Acidobacteriota bacterium]
MTRDNIAIVLSAGYFGFFAHAGFMRAIEERNIDYTAIAGSSAGAIVASLHASGVPASEIIATLGEIRKSDFWDSTGAGGFIRALLKKGRGWTGLLKGELFERIIERHLRAKTFEACSRRLYLTAFNLATGKDDTFHSGTIADKVRASCSYPFLMAPRRIGEADYWDGGFLAKIPLEAMIAREQPDRILVHYLPTREDERGLNERNWTAFAMLEKSLTAARKEIEQHRVEALGEFKERLSWIEPIVPQLGPDKLAQGNQAVDAAYQFALKRLAEIGL